MAGVVRGLRLFSRHTGRHSDDGLGPGDVPQRGESNGRREAAPLGHPDDATEVYAFHAAPVPEPLPGPRNGHTAITGPLWRQPGCAANPYPWPPADLPRPGGNENPTGTVHTGPGQPADLPRPDGQVRTDATAPGRLGADAVKSHPSPGQPYRFTAVTIITAPPRFTGWVLDLVTSNLDGYTDPHLWVDDYYAKVTTPCST